MFGFSFSFKSVSKKQNLKDNKDNRWLVLVVPKNSNDNVAHPSVLSLSKKTTQKQTNEGRKANINKCPEVPLLLAHSFSWKTTLSQTKKKGRLFFPRTSCNSFSYPFSALKQTMGKTKCFFSFQEQNLVDVSKTTSLFFFSSKVGLEDNWKKSTVWCVLPMPVLLFVLNEKKTVYSGLTQRTGLLVQPQSTWSSGLNKQTHLLLPLCFEEARKNKGKNKRVSQRGFLAAGLLLRKKIWETKKKFRQSSNQKTEEQTGLRKDSQFWTSLDDNWFYSHLTFFFFFFPTSIYISCNLNFDLDWITKQKKERRGMITYFFLSLDM